MISPEGWTLIAAIAATLDVPTTPADAINALAACTDRQKAYATIEALLALDETEPEVEVEQC